MLFIHPLMCLRKIAPSNSTSESRLKRVVSMACKGVAVCALSDMFALALVHLIFPKNFPRSVNSAVYDFSLCVNTVSLLLSFEDSPLVSSNKKTSSCWKKSNDVEIAEISENTKKCSDSGEKPKVIHTLMPES